MEAKDTVMNDEQLELDWTDLNGEPTDTMVLSRSEFDTIKQAQAEISFKAGWEAHEKIVPAQLKAHGDIYYKAGQKEVVGFFELNFLLRQSNKDERIYSVDQDEWQAKLREWGIDTG